MASEQHNKPVTGYPAHPAGGQPSYAMGPGAGYAGGYSRPYPAYPAYQPPPPGPYSAGGFNRDGHLFRRLVAIIITIAVIFGIAILISWLVLRPHRPIFYIQDAHVSRLNVTGDLLYSKMQFNVTARNSNKKIGIYYDEISADSVYEGNVIGFNQLGEFYQGHQNTTFISFPLSSDDFHLKGDTSSRLKDALARKSVKIVVRLEASIRFKIGSWNTRHYTMDVFCNPTIDWNGTSGSLSRPERCDVEI